MTAAQQDARRQDERAALDDWRQSAACVDFDSELWFPISPAPQQTARAVRICNTCPVEQVCRSWAIDNLPHGVAGGLTEDERRDIRLGRARPAAPPAPVRSPFDGVSVEAQHALMVAGQFGRVAEEVSPRVKSELVRTGLCFEGIPSGKADQRGGVRLTPPGRAEFVRWLATRERVSS